MLVKTDTFVGRIIRWITRCEYNHAALVVSRTAVLEATWPKGIRIIKMAYRDYIVLRHPHASREKAGLLVARALDKVGAGYDSALIVQLLLRIWHLGRYNLNNPNKYICTEIIQYAYRKVNLKLFRKGDMRTVTPKSFIGKNCLLEKVD